ncbi:MAG: deaminase [Anaerolinea sp.]|nr:deaminase [Anaerolinea sp.]
MTLKCFVFIAASLDGFIAGPDGDISWLNNTAYAIDSEDFGIAEFYSSVDTLVMGRKSYETALGFAEWPYSHLRVVVLSHKTPVIPPALLNKVEHMTGSPAEVVQRLETSGSHRIYVDGGQTIQGFLKAGLIQEITLTTIPILLGGGIPLFGSFGREFSLQMLTSRTYSNGFVQTKYKIVPTN